MNVNDKAALTVDIDEFDEFFAAVNQGREPYDWQRALLRQVVTMGRWPDAVVAPTGAGKSSVLEVHVFAVAMTHSPGWDGPGPLAAFGTWWGAERSLTTWPPGPRVCSSSSPRSRTSRARRL